MRLRVFLLTTGIAALAAAAPARAAVYTVTGTADPGSCEGFACTGLQAALDAARLDEVADEIDLQTTTYAASKGISMSDDTGVTIVGKGAHGTVIRGSSGIRAITNSGIATLEHLKVTGGSVPQGTGGGIGSSGALTLDHVEVSDNQALDGGGIASTGSLTIAYSLIASNTASGYGGGLAISSGDGTAATLSAHDSTVAFNTARIRSGGGGIDMRGNPANSATLQRVTVAGNIGGNPGLGTGGILLGDGERLSARATIVAGNRNVTGDASNCGATTPRDDGSNLESGSDCGFTSGEQNANPGFPSGLVDGGGETGVLPIPSTSPAVDLAPACTRVTDQRDLPRPQGSGCDAGAYEYDQAPDIVIDGGPGAGPTPQFTFHSDEPGVTFECRLTAATAFSACASPQGYEPAAGAYTFAVRAIDGKHPDPPVASRDFTIAGPPAPTITGGPSGVTTDAAPAFSFSSTDATVRFVCRLAGPGGPGTEAPCTSPQGFGTLAPGSYTFYVTAVDGAGNRTTTARAFTVAATPQGTPTPTPTPPAPAFHRTVVLQPASGKVRVRLKGSKRFVTLDATQGIPLGSEVDARHGKVELSSVPKRGGAPQTALFYGGVFIVTQRGRITQLALSQRLAKCRAKQAAAAKKRRHRPRARHLWGNGHGSFRTKGRYSAATVRGTKWNVRDSCRGTLTRVRRGVVSVKDFARHRTRLVRAGHRYLAKPKRRR